MTGSGKPPVSQGLSPFWPPLFCHPTPGTFTTLTWGAVEVSVTNPIRNPCPILEPLVEVLERKRTVHFHCHRADGLRMAVRIAREFDFEVVLQHATEGYRVADQLVRLKVPVSLTLVNGPGGKLQAAGLLEEDPAILDCYSRSGVTTEHTEQRQQVIFCFDRESRRVQEGGSFSRTSFLARAEGREPRGGCGLVGR